MKRCLSVLLIVPLLSGCWSSRSIEELNIIVGSAIDKAENGKFSSTLQYVVPGAIQTNKGAGAMGTKPYLNITEKGVSLEPIGWETTLKKEGFIFGAHQKSIVVASDVARELNLEELMDLHYRDMDIRGSAIVFIAKDKAKETLELSDRGIPALRLHDIATQQLTTRLLKPVTLTDTFAKLASGTSFLMQQIVKTPKGHIKFDSAAVIKGKSGKMIGTFSKKEIEGYNWLTGDSRGGAVKAYQSENEHPIFYEIKSLKSKITPTVMDGRISFNVLITSDGRVAEYWNPNERPAFENKNLKRIEKAAEKEVERLVGNVIQKMQKEYKVDVAGFGNQLRIHYPRLWNEVKGNWDKTFSEVSITYQADLSIKDYGMIGKKNTRN
ncbi:Ger(x)C family spore germination protein [Fictibacillus iocasae]|uniref:Ger(X)C family spore germination protein n=1 Tax=Fictibacillus iocasae TaxID=2715437 RepID=A0ABW2NQ07_9BACL